MPFAPPTEKQARILWSAVTALAVGILLALAGALLWGFGRVLAVLSPVLWPLAVAGVLAYLLDPVVDWLESRRVPRPRAILVVFGAALGLILALAASVVPQLFRETRELAERVPQYSAHLQQKVDAWMTHPPDLLRRVLGVWQGGQAAPAAAPASFGAGATGTNTPTGTPAPPAGAGNLFGKALDRDALRSATQWLGEMLPKIGSWFLGQVGKVASVFGMLAGLALVPVYTFYFLLEKRGIQKQWTDYLPVARSEFKDELVFVLKSVNDYLIVFFRGQVLVAICDGVLYTIGFWLIGLPYAFLIGVMAIALTMIPFLGAMTTCGAALVIAFVQFGDWQHPMLVLAVFAVVQTIEGLVIQPKIIGDRVGLHPLTIIVSVLVGTTLMGGLIGGVLAIPLTAALRVVMFRYVWKGPAGKSKSIAAR